MQSIPILLTEERWMNSQLSVARFYGSIKVNGDEYIIVNEKGRTIFQSAIPPGKPADLISRKWLSVYKTMGRDAFITWLAKQPKGQDRAEMLKQAKAYAKTLKQQQCHSTSPSATSQPDLFSASPASARPSNAPTAH